MSHRSQVSDDVVSLDCTQVNIQFLPPLSQVNGTSCIIRRDSIELQ